ncbi:hypothetical protein NBRC116583_10590 [Arenicella sp. 4NH20-0111]|uniref:DUF6916 family protein n=1 Tax=Arenicella sp. 4NH20-0111 TaxID=3127648 RepID=UPI0031049E07
MDVWRLDKFKTLVGEKVKISDLEEKNACEVIVSDVVQSHNLGTEWESFSVIMNTEAEVEQGSFILSHEDAGTTTLFITANSSMELESVFNLHVGAH